MYTLLGAARTYDFSLLAYKSHILKYVIQMFFILAILSDCILETRIYHLKS